MATLERTAPSRLTCTPIVIAPDVIVDLVFARAGRERAAQMLFDMIAADVEAGTERWPAYIAPVTVSTIHYLIWRGGGPGGAWSVVGDLLRLVRVAPLTKEDYVEAMRFYDFAYDDALQFVTCRRVGAPYLVTGERYGGKQAPVKRRTAGEVVGLLGR